MNQNLVRLYPVVNAVIYVQLHVLVVSVDIIYF